MHISIDCEVTIPFKFLRIWLVRLFGLRFEQQRQVVKTKIVKSSGYQWSACRHPHTWLDNPLIPRFLSRSDRAAGAGRKYR